MTLSTCQPHHSLVTGRGFQAVTLYRLPLKFRGEASDSCLGRLEPVALNLERLLAFRVVQDALASITDVAC